MTNNNNNNIKALNDRVTQLSTLVEQLLASQQLESEKYEKRLKDEAERNAKKLQSMEERLTATSGYSIHKENQNMPTSIKDELPSKFVLSDLPIFQGHESPIVHIRAFKSQMAIKGVPTKLWSTLFPHSLAAVPKSWFYSLEPHRITSFEEITLEFHKQYRDNEDTQASIRSLEVMKQREDEGFTEYLTRWKMVSTQIPNRPSEDVLVGKFINNLRTVYQSQMRYSNIQTFAQLTKVGDLIEDDLRDGIMANYTT
jgi:ElaB/YqjD/DUF883 family membrane-anchored ribosome-binding protein